MPAATGALERRLRRAGHGRSRPWPPRPSARQHGGRVGRTRAPPLSRVAAAPPGARTIAPPARGVPGDHRARGECSDAAFRAHPRGVRSRVDGSARREAGRARGRGASAACLPARRGSAGAPPSVAVVRRRVRQRNVRNTQARRRHHPISRDVRPQPHATDPNPYPAAYARPQQRATASPPPRHRLAAQSQSLGRDPRLAARTGRAARLARRAESQRRGLQRALAAAVCRGVRSRVGREGASRAAGDPCGSLPPAHPTAPPSAPAPAPSP